MSKLENKLGSVDLVKELLINRYLLSSILSSLYRIQQANDYNFKVLMGQAKEKKNEKKENPLTPKERKEIRKEKKRVLELNIIRFEKFAITVEQYDALVKEYGVEIVTEACVLLDGYLRNTNRDLKDSYKKLKEWAIHQAMKNRINEIRTDIMQATSISYKDIEDKTTALKYIKSVPSHRRNIDSGVKYLIAKFNLAEEEK